MLTLGTGAQLNAQRSVALDIPDRPNGLSANPIMYHAREILFAAYVLDLHPCAMCIPIQ